MVNKQNMEGRCWLIVIFLRWIPHLRVASLVVLDWILLHHPLIARKKEAGAFKTGDKLAL